MTEVNIVYPDGGDLVELGPIRLRILETGATTDHRLGMAEITIAPHTVGPVQHRHAQHDEGFYVVAGTARFTVGAATYDAPAGTLVMVPPETPHTFANVSGDPVVLINTFTPDHYIRYFPELRDLIAAHGPPTRQATRGLMRRYATTPADDFPQAPPVQIPVGRTIMTNSRTYALSTAAVGAVDLTVAEIGTGRTYLLLHGGGGPQTVSAFADLLSASGGRVIAPVHPGFGGTPRPETLGTVGQLAHLYLSLLDELDLRAVTVVGNSLGGWVAAELALLHSPRVETLVILDGIGIDVPDHPIIDFFAIPSDQISQYSFHDAQKFRLDPATLPPEVLAALPGNRASLAVYAGTTMVDPTLAGRLGAVTIPTLVLWGDADRIVDADYGCAYAAAIPGAQFELLTATGHLPHVETPAQVLDAIQRFALSDHQHEDSPTWTHEYSAETDLQPSAIWASMRALRTGEIPSSNGDQLHLQGTFAVGSIIVTKPAGVTETLVSRISELDEPRTFAVETVFNGLLLLLRYTIHRTDDSTQITLHLGISGPNAATVAPQIGPRISADYPEAVRELIHVARQRATAPAGPLGPAQPGPNPGPGGLSDKRCFWPTRRRSRRGRLVTDDRDTQGHGLHAEGCEEDR